jgi:hypothetical protein
MTTTRGSRPRDDTPVMQWTNIPVFASARPEYWYCYQRINNEFRQRHRLKDCPTSTPPTGTTVTDCAPIRELRIGSLRVVSIFRCGWLIIVVAAVTGSDSPWLKPIKLSWSPVFESVLFGRLIVATFRCRETFGNIPSIVVRFWVHRIVSVPLLLMLVLLLPATGIREV